MSTTWQERALAHNRRVGDIHGNQGLENLQLAFYTFVISAVLTLGSPAVAELVFDNEESKKMVMSSGVFVGLVGLVASIGLMIQGRVDVNEGRDWHKSPVHY